MWRSAGALQMTAASDGGSLEVASEPNFVVADQLRQRRELTIDNAASFAGSALSALGTLSRATRSTSRIFLRQALLYL